MGQTAGFAAGHSLSDRLLASIHLETPGGYSGFLIWKPAIFRKVKEIKRLSGGVVLYAAQSNAQIDDEIEEKSGFRTETS